VNDGTSKGSFASARGGVNDSTSKESFASAREGVYQCGGETLT